jgi:hypothetical protein
MIELLRNCSNGSEVATYLVVRDTVKKIVKVAATPVGVRNLRREMEGWAWYQRKRYPEEKDPVCRMAQERDSFLKVEIAFVEGEKADCRKGLEANEGMIKKTIEHYCKIWPYSPDGGSPLHGDFSLDNVIYNSDGVHMIDWEHFHEKDAPWGFDPIYLLFETLFFGVRHRGRPSPKDVGIIVENITLLNRKQKLPLQLIESPLRFLVDFITDNYALWGQEISQFRNKFPILAFTEERISSIDDIVCSRLHGGQS